MSIARSPLSVDVVDDDADVLGSLRFLLETEGFDVRTFASASDFLANGLANAPDCIVIDYKMKSMNGLDLIRHLLAEQIAPPMVLITGHPDETIVQKAAAIGIRHVVLKPHVEESLMVHVRAAIAEDKRTRREPEAPPVKPLGGSP